MSEKKKQNFKKIKEARDAFIAKYQSQVEDLVDHFTAGMGGVEGKLGIVAHCTFEDLDNLSEKTEEKIKDILPKTFEYDGIEYPIKIQFVGPAVFQSENKN